MTTIKNKVCDPFWKSLGSRINKWLGRSSKSKFYVVYPPLADAEEIREHPERFDPTQWLREDVVYAWFHEANAVANRANRQAGKIVAIVCEEEQPSEGC